MRQITESIMNSFLNSNKNHLIITGSICGGKSRLAMEIVDNLVQINNIPGITTHFIPEQGVVLRELRTGYETAIGKVEDCMYPVEEGFSGLGVEALKRVEDDGEEWALVDEIGFLESNHKMFQNAVRTLLEKKRVIMVVRKQDLPFLNELRNREDAYVVDVDDWHKKIGCIVMASGISARFGSNKLLATIEGQSLIQIALDKTEAIFEKRVVLTRTKEVAELCEKQGIPVILHEYPNRNQAIRLGVEYMKDMDACIFCPCDQPMLKRHSLKRMRNAYSFEQGNIWRLAWKENAGTPILFDKKYFGELCELPDKKGGSYVAMKHSDKVQTLEAESEKELYDIDTPEDLKKITL